MVEINVILRTVGEYHLNNLHIHQKCLTNVVCDNFGELTL